MTLFRILSIIALLFIQMNSSLAQSKKLPNIILIFMDDMGYGDLGSTGALGYQTSTLDRLANHGIRFTNFLVPQPVCSASRAALLTGTYPNRMGVQGAYMPNAKTGLNSQELTLAEMLKSKGYATQMIGKWHLGNEPEFLPNTQGFDQYLGLPYSNDMWPVDFDGSPAKPDSWLQKYPVLPLLQTKVNQAIPDTVLKINGLAEQAKLTGIYTQRAVEFIDQHKRKLFFLYLAHSMSHVPIAASEQFVGSSQQGLFGDMMQEIDWSMQEILNSLKKAKIEDNTLIIFTSDNGPWLNFGNHNGSSSGFREGKGASWEGGVRVPCIISWPKVIQEGRIENNLTSSMDIFASIAELIDYRDIPHQTDGISFLQNIYHPESKAPRDRLYYYYNRNDLEAVRFENWKLILPHSYRSYEDILPADNGFPGKYNHKTSSKTLELYDLRRDPGERNNVIEMYPEIKEKLLQIAEEARSDLGDDLTKREGKNRRPVGKIQ